MNLRQVRTKTKSITNVRKITKAMQLVSAIKMKKAQQLAVDGKPYHDALEYLIRNVSKGIDISSSQLLTAKEKKHKTLVLYISSNKGLCGSFHTSLNRFVLRNIEYQNHDWITVGKKAGMVMSRLGGKVIADFSTTRALFEVSAIFDLILKEFFAGSYNEVFILYNKFISSMKFETVYEKILPIHVNVKKDSHVNVNFNYIIEPDPTTLVDTLLRNYLEEKIREAIISSEAVEHSARMMAMKTATDNATDVIYSLTLLGNKLRQTKITSELIDMVTAKESVEAG
ncbi:MAG: ATP synthase F1 subunit gamma [Candidatus Roizmanbacteria bacterium]